jgi:hypothetical protein
MEEPRWSLKQAFILNVLNDHTAETQSSLLHSGVDIPVVLIRENDLDVPHVPIEAPEEKDPQFLKSSQETSRQLSAHKQTWEKIVDAHCSENDLFLVLSGKLQFPSFFKDIIEYSLQTAPENFDLLLLSGGSLKVPVWLKVFNFFISGASSAKGKFINDDWMKPAFIFNCNAYMITKAGASILLKLIEKDPTILPSLPLEFMLTRYNNKREANIYASIERTIVSIEKQDKERITFPLLLFYPILKWGNSENIDLYKKCFSQPIFLLQGFEVNLGTLYIVVFTFFASFLSLVTGTTVRRILSVLFIVDVVNGNAKQVIAVMFLAKLCFYLGTILRSLL